MNEEKYYKNETLQNIQVIKRFNFIKVFDKKSIKVNDLSDSQYSVNKK